MNISKEYERVYQDIGRTDPEFSQALEKWQQYFCSAVYKLSKITGKDVGDVFQHLLMELVKIRDTHRIPLYRFNGRIWEAEIIDGSTYYLIKPRHNKLPMNSIWAGKDLIKPVKKAKLSSMVYREITQQYSDIIAAHFCCKNGFEKIKKTKNPEITIYKYDNRLYQLSKRDGDFLCLKEPGNNKSFWINESNVEKVNQNTRMVTVRSGKKGTNLERKKINTVRRFASEISLWEPIFPDSDTLILDTIKSSDLNPEELLILGEILGIAGRNKKYPVLSPNC